MLLLPDFYAFYGVCAFPACVGSYLIDSGFRASSLVWRWVDLSLGFRGVGLLAGGSPAATHFLLLRQKKVSKEKATPLSASPFASATGATCGARSSRGRARTRCAQTIALPDPSGPALLGAARRGVGLESDSGSGSGEYAQSASSPPRIRIRTPNPSGWAEERRQKRIRARDCLSRRRVRARPRFC